MKVLKSVRVRNFAVDVEAYTCEELHDLMNRDYSFLLNVDGPLINAGENTRNLRVSASMAKTINVVWSEEYEMYLTEVTMDNGDKVYVVL